MSQNTGITITPKKWAALKSSFPGAADSTLIWYAQYEKVGPNIKNEQQMILRDEKIDRLFS